MKVNKELENKKQLRQTCYQCMRPKTSCLCQYVNPVETKTHFIFLMHPMEYKKEKNGTGRLTHLQLKNSRIIMGVDFTNNKEVNDILNNPDNECFILYPGAESFNLSEVSFSDIQKKKARKCIFIIDGTWPCAKKMLKLSRNLHSLPKISFDNKEKSQFLIKQQPAPLCLSTIESTLKLLNILKDQGVENCSTQNFLLPFNKMIEYYIECVKNPPNNSYRPRSSKKITPKDRYKDLKRRKLFFT